MSEKLLVGNEEYLIDFTIMPNIKDEDKIFIATFLRGKNHCFKIFDRLFFNAPVLEQGVDKMILEISEAELERQRKRAEALAKDDRVILFLDKPLPKKLRTWNIPVENLVAKIALIPECKEIHMDDERVRLFLDDNKVFSSLLNNDPEVSIDNLNNAVNTYMFRDMLPFINFKHDRDSLYSHEEINKVIEPAVEIAKEVDLDVTVEETEKVVKIDVPVEKIGTGKVYVSKDPNANEANAGYDHSKGLSTEDYDEILKDLLSEDNKN